MQFLVANDVRLQIVRPDGKVVCGRTRVHKCSVGAEILQLTNVQASEDY